MESMASVFRMFKTVPADAVAIVRSYPPVVVCFAAALAGTALVFDVFYLIASPGLTLALVYTVPVLAGLIAGLVAAADDVGLKQRVLTRTVSAAVALGITNAMLVAMIAAIRRTGPSNWSAGGQAVLFAGCTVLAVAVAIVACRNMIWALGIELRTRLPHRRVRVPVAAAAVARLGPPVSKKTSARSKPVRAKPPPLPEPDEDEATPVVLPPLRIVDLDEARVVTPWTESTGHADRLNPRPRRAHAVPPSRRSHRPGKRPHN